jgi:hypothetical protein
VLSEQLQSEHVNEDRQFSTALYLLSFPTIDTWQAATSASEAECGIRSLIDKRTIFSFQNYKSHTWTTKSLFVQLLCCDIIPVAMSAPAASSSSHCKVMLSKHVANGLLQEVQEGLKTLEKPPHLVGFLANNDPAALMYAQWTQKTCEEQ